MTVELETPEVKFAARGQASPDALDLYSRASANLRRMLETLGLERRTKNVTPTVHEYLAHHQREVEDAIDLSPCEATK